MRYRTAVKTGRIAALQADALRPGELHAPYAAETRVVKRFVWVFALLLVAFAFSAQRSVAQDAGEDSAITKRIESALAKDTALAGMNIKVETRDGLVSLTGFVRSLEDAARAGALAEAVPGVSAVRNDLRVANRPSRASAPAAAARIHG